MADADPPGIIVRAYQEADRQKVETFRCAPYGPRWCEAAEKVIREAPGVIASGEYNAALAVADHKDDGVVGVVVFGIEPHRPLMIYSLGVVIPRHRQGIGTRLKQAIMAAAATANNPPITVVVSKVHRNNYRMTRLNDKLGVGSTKDPDDGEFLMTAIRVEPEYP